MYLEIKHGSLIQHKRGTMFKSMSVFPVTSFTLPYVNFQPHQMTFKLYLAVSCYQALMQAVLCLKCPPSLCLLNSFLSFRSSSNFIFFPQTYDLRELLQSYFLVCLSLLLYRELFEGTDCISFVFYVPHVQHIVDTKLNIC